MPEEIEIWDIDRLILDPQNARTHSPEQIEELAGSVQGFGFTNPVLADEDGRVIAGAARTLAVRKLGFKRIPVIVVRHLTTAEKRAYALADNQIALHAEWDNELLRVRLEELKAEGIDLALVGFRDGELDALVDELERSLESADEDKAPVPEADVVTRLGDVWELGQHRLICADSTDPSSYVELLAGEVAGMAFTDSPYNVAYHAPQSPDGQLRHTTIANDDLGKDFPAFLEVACRNMIAHVRGALYICMSSSELHTLYSAFTRAGGHWSTFLIWGKNTFTLGRSDYQRQFEPILYGWPEGQPHHWCGARNQGDLWLIDKPHSNDLHPTMKPVALVERAVINSSQRGGIVLDPFAGSGTTLIACEKTGRKARLIEIEPKYCDVIIRRWQEFSRARAIHKTTGRTVDDLIAERVSPTQPEAPAAPGLLAA
jgi:DNA modification methylase